MTPIEKSLVTVLGLSLLLAVTAVPLLLRKVPRNAVYGYRTRATLSCDELWYSANAHFGRGLIAAASFSALAAAVVFLHFPPPAEDVVLFTVVLIVAPSLLATFATARYIRRQRPQHGGE